MRVLGVRPGEAVCSWQIREATILSHVHQDGDEMDQSDGVFELEAVDCAAASKKPLGPKHKCVAH